MEKTVQNASRDYEFSAVQDDGRCGMWSMIIIMLGFSFFSASMWAGGTIGSALTSPAFIAAVLLGNLLLSCYTGLLAYIAGKTHLSTHLLAHYSFGRKGSYLPSLLLAVTQTGWFGVGVAMFAVPVSKLFPEVPLWILVWGAGLLMTSTAYFGIRALAWLSAVAVPAIIILGCMSMQMAINDFGGWREWLEVVPEAEPMSLMTAVGLVVASFISGGTLTPDFVRFSRNAKISVTSTVVAFFIGNSLMFLFGAVGAALYQLNDISEVLFRQGLIVFGIIVLGLNIWTTNDNAIYASGLGLSNVFKLPKRYMVLVIGIVGTASAIFLYNNFVDWLNVLNAMLPSIGAVIIADYFIHRSHYTDASYRFSELNVGAVAAWFVGVVCALTLPGIACVNSVVASIVVYVLWSRFAGNKR